ncbi:ras-related protein Rab-24-like [Arctopsyche grandis]|uniref:ras-related protein Rab-24-like n=1 Tax=Arctopsyche grandis TaxID=121162 RepID=UPI00406D674A
MTFIDIKVILLGDVSVGKTSIFIRFFDSKWNRQYHQNTIGFVFKNISMEANGRNWNMGVWDTAGSERFEALTTMYYRNTTCAILCFDPSVSKSWDRVQFWHSELKKHIDCKIYICATKKDLLDLGEITYAVDMALVTKFADEIGAVYFHVSSKSGENVDKLFKKIVDDCANDPEYIKELSQRICQNNEIVTYSELREKISDKYIRSDTCCSIL